MSTETEDCLNKRYNLGAQCGSLAAGPGRNANGQISPRRPQDLAKALRELKQLRAELVKAEAEAAQRSDDPVKETNRDNVSVDDP